MIQYKHAVLLLLVWISFLCGVWFNMQYMPCPEVDCDECWPPYHRSYEVSTFPQEYEMEM